MDEKNYKSPIKLNTSFSKIRSRSISDATSLSPSTSNNNSENSFKEVAVDGKEEIVKLNAYVPTKRKSVSLHPEINHGHTRRSSMLSQLSNHVKSYSFDATLNNKNIPLSPINTNKEKASPESSPSRSNNTITSPVKVSGVSGNIPDSTNIMLEMNDEVDNFFVSDSKNLSNNNHGESDNENETRLNNEERNVEKTFMVKINENYPHLKITISSILLWYLFSMSISVYNRWMFASTSLDFKFPILITSFHQLILTALAILTLILFPQFRLSNSSYTKISADDSTMEPEEKITYKMPIREYVFNILPCSIASAGDIGLGNTAFRFISLSLYTMVKTSSLIFVLLWGVLLKLEKFTLRIFTIVCIMTFGVGMMIYGQHESDPVEPSVFNQSSNKGIVIGVESHQVSKFNDVNHNPTMVLFKRIINADAKNFVFIGVSLVLVSACMSGLRWALTQIMLKQNKRTKNPILTMLYISPGMSVFLFIVGVIVEGVKEFHDAKIWSEKGFLMTIILILIPGFLAFFMTISEFVLLQYASLLTLSIAGIFKELLTIFVSWVVFGDKLSTINIIGLIITFADIVWYNIYRFEQNLEAVKRNEPEENEYVDIELNSMYRDT